MLLDRDGFAGDHRFVNDAAAVKDNAVDGSLFSRPDTQAIAGLHPFERDVVLAAVGAEQARGLRAQVEQGADRGAGAAAGTELHDLA